MKTNALSTGLKNIFHAWTCLFTLAMESSTSITNFKHDEEHLEIFRYSVFIHLTPKGLKKMYFVFWILHALKILRSLFAQNKASTSVSGYLKK